MATTTTIPSAIERADIHKSCKSLESVTSLLVNHIETLNSLILINKKLAKALRETASVKGTNGIPANALNTSAYIFEAIFEVDTKFTRIADKEVDALTGDIKKWFKKLAKEEKAHDERLANASAKLKQAGQTYEKKAKRKDADLSEEHTRYLAILNTVGPEMNQDKHDHALYVTQRHTALVSNVAATVSRLAETEWGRACEYVRKFGPFIGGIGECRALCEGGWNGELPADLPGEPLDDVSSTSMTMNNEPVRAGTTRPTTPLNPTAPVATTNSSTATVASPEIGTRRRSGSVQVVDNIPKHEISQSPETSLLSVPEPENSKQPFDEPSSPVNPAPAAADTYNSGALRQSPSPLRPLSSHNRVSETITEEEQLQHPAEREPSLETEPKRYDTQSQVSNETFTISSNLSSDNIPHKSDNPPMTTRPTPEPIKEAASTSKPSRPLPLPSPRGIRQIDLERMQSTDTLTSRVAAMRERYDTRTDAPLTPTSRDLPVSRTTQKVADIANRYTSPFRSDNSPSGQTGLLPPNDHFPTFQERFNGRGLKFRVVDKPPPESYREELEPESYDGYEDEVFRYSGVTLQDRSDRGGGRRGGYPGRGVDEHLQTSRAESTYYDELGVRTTRGGKAHSGTIDVLELRAREAQLLEQERRLELERARLVSVRDSVVTDAAAAATTSYNRKYSESPQPLSSYQAFSQGQRMPSPEDHSPNCGCQHCSQFYATPPNLSRQTRPSSSTQDPPSPLRPGTNNKQQQWRRMSTGPMVTSFIPPPGKNLGMSVRNISSPSITHLGLPPEDPSRSGGNGRRRSFDLVNDRDIYSNERRGFPRR